MPLAAPPIAVRRLRTAQPAAAALSINWAHPLAQGLVFAAIPHKNGMLDVVRGGFCKTNGATETASAKGNNDHTPAKYMVRGVSSETFNITTGLDEIINGRFSIFIDGSLKLNGSTHSVIESVDPATGYGHRVGFMDSGTTNTFYWWSNGIPVLNAGATALGTNSEQYAHRIAVSVSPTSATSCDEFLFANNALRTSASGPIKSQPSPEGRVTRIFSTYDGSNGECSASIILAWNRPITLDEYQALYANPWLIFAPATRPTLSVLASKRTPATPAESRLLPIGGSPRRAVAPYLSVIRGPRKSQPTALVGVNRSTRAGSAIRNLIPLGAVNQDICTGAPVSFSSGGSVYADSSGLSLRGNGSAAAGTVPLDLSPYSQIALSFWLYWDAFANNDALAMEHGTNFGTSHGFLIDPNSGAPFAGYFQIGSNGIARSFTRFSAPAAGWHHYVVHCRSQGGAGSDVYGVYVDGVLQALSATGGSGSTANFGNNTLYLFSRAGSSLIGAGRLRNIVIRPFYEVSAAEALVEYERPWELFAGSAKPIWTPWS